ncbi:hypothetical protein DCAR_0100252 [Daucus carota subsp. sativus]|uniref:Cytochrome c oxidase polypeptide II n=1 Tax=Daucus carota subsp. sativus TaxID=79200 RepID=A0AAF1AHY6_DAUCS|nr:hypothetical protein DCAR_0100252 [Daucus carota subsp. sativus]
MELLSRFFGPYFLVSSRCSLLYHHLLCYTQWTSSDEQSLTFDSYTIPEDDPELGQSRLLEVDNRVVVPAKTHLRIIVTSADVPHSWAVPSSGVKCDAVPGRLNQISISVQREGVYYGQCSEICGTNHAFTQAVSRKDYGSRVSNQLIPQTGEKPNKRWNSRLNR